MSTAVFGDVILRGHCAVQWQEEGPGGARVYFVEERHCRDCLTDLARRRDGKLVWVRREVGEDDTTTRVKGSRRIGRHCAFRWERCDDVLKRGKPVRLYWIERQHCADCVALLRMVCAGELDAEFVDLAARGMPRPPSRPELPPPNLPPAGAPPGPARPASATAGAALPSAPPGPRGPR